MKVFLRMVRPESYYAGPKQWVSDREHALDLQTIEHAVELGRDGDLDAMVVVVSSGDPGCDWFLPLRRPSEVSVQAASARVSARLPKAA
jgi:hypothetical protein